MEYYAQQLDKINNENYINNCGKNFSYDNKVYTTLIEKISDLLRTITDKEQKKQLLAICRMNLEERGYMDNTNWQVLIFVVSVDAVLTALLTAMNIEFVSIIKYFQMAILILTLVVVIISVAKNVFKPNRRSGFYTLVISVLEDQL